MSKLDWQQATLASKRMLEGMSRAQRLSDKAERCKNAADDFLDDNEVDKANKALRLARRLMLKSSRELAACHEGPMDLEYSFAPWEDIMRRDKPTEEIHGGEPILACSWKGLHPWLDGKKEDGFLVRAKSAFGSWSRIGVIAVRSPICDPWRFRVDGARATDLSFWSDNEEFLCYGTPGHKLLTAWYGGVVDKAVRLARMWANM